MGIFIHAPRGLYPIRSFMLLDGDRAGTDGALSLTRAHHAFVPEIVIYDTPFSAETAPSRDVEQSQRDATRMQDESV